MKLANGAGLALGLVLPGAGQCQRGDWFAGFLVLIATSFFWLSAALEIVVNNLRSYPAPLHLFEELTNLRSPVAIVPHVVVAVLFALFVHIGAAIWAGRSR